MTPQEKIVGQLEHSTRPLTFEELGEQVGLAGEKLKENLSELEERGEVHQLKGRRYALPQQINLAVGTLDATRGGAGYVLPDRRDQGDPDIYVPAHKLGNAAHGDRVMVRLDGKKHRGSPQAALVRVLERARTTVVGTLKRSKTFGFVTPDDQRLGFEVYLPRSELGKAQTGQKVVAFIEEWGDGQKSPEGSLVEVLGFPHEPGVDVLSIVKEQGFDDAFPPEVEKEAARARFAVGDRLDLRDRTVFTIDPHDAQDFDDALSIRRLEENLFEVGIHVADVSHYVKPGTALDDEAYERATSVYLVDRVIPMLPERLSNDLCSLRPDEDRLAFSVILVLDGEAEVRDYKICETVIRSRHRLSYGEAQAMLESRSTDNALLWEVQTLRRLAKILQKKRASRGSLDFDLPEAIVELDDEGFPLDIQESVRLDSMRLVEEFMLLANQTVARHAFERDMEFVYRVHAAPPVGKLERLWTFVSALGYTLPPRKEELVFAEVLKQARGRAEEELVNALVLRAMEQAHYSVRNVGHFGLAAEHYTHFTSPIRRYPDLEVHRLLKGESQRSLEELALHCSLRERSAADAERSSIALKKVEFMERHLGQEFDGVVCGVKPFGVFVRLAGYFVEGLVPVAELNDDYYDFREEEFALVGRSGGRRFRLADPVRVKVGAVDKDRRQIDFELVKAEGSG